MSPILAAALALGLWAAPARAQSGAPMPMPDLAARQEAFGEIDQATMAGDADRAAELLLALAQDPAQQPFHAEAWARLAATIQQKGFPAAALHAYARALEADAAMVSSVAGTALDLAGEVGDTALLEPVFAQNVGIEVDEATRGRIAYLAARQANSDRSYGTASAFLKMVPAAAADYAEAKALEGVVLSRSGRYMDAVAALQIALAAGSGRPDAARWTNLLNLNIGRAYFGAGEFVRAIEYFAKVERSSPWWAEAQFERAWAHFRLDDLNGTLGLLYTHSSPFFEQEYYPEAALLEVYSLFLLCKFPAASEKIDAFQVRFSAMREQLSGVTGRSPDELYAAMRDDLARGDEATTLPIMVVRPFRGEDRLRDTVATVQRLEAELGRLGSASGPWVAPARQWLQARRDALVQAEGERIRDRARHMEDELSAMLSNAEMNKLDILQMESRMFERASYTGVMEKAKRTVDRELRIRQGYRWWPYEGEYWADEVGWFRIDTAPECPESMRAGQ